MRTKKPEGRWPEGKAAPLKDQRLIRWGPWCPGKSECCPEWWRTRGKPKKIYILCNGIKETIYPEACCRAFLELALPWQLTRRPHMDGLLHYSVNFVLILIPALHQALASDKSLRSHRGLLHHKSKSPLQQHRCSGPGNVKTQRCRL